MEISVLDKQTVQCIMTEAEIADYGMDKRSIYQNDERAADFFRQVMERARKETGFLKNGPSIAVHAVFLSDELLEITFFAGAIGKTGQVGITGQAGQAARTAQDVEWMEAVLLKSKNLMHIVDFCRNAPVGLEASLYRYRRVYFLLADVKGYGVHETAALFNLADEYMDGICYTKSVVAFLAEHGTCVIKGHAVGRLREL